MCDMIYNRCPIKNDTLTGYTVSQECHADEMCVWVSLLTTYVGVSYIINCYHITACVVTISIFILYTWNCRISKKLRVLTSQ